ncbi:MAG: hypothetical protein AAGC56_03015 [Pseudomonadota bacterium]
MTTSNDDAPNAADAAAGDPPKTVDAAAPDAPAARLVRDALASDKAEAGDAAKAGGSAGTANDSVAADDPVTESDAVAMIVDDSVFDEPSDEARVRAVEVVNERPGFFSSVFGRLAGFSVGLLRTLFLALIMLPFVLAAFLTADLPFRALDRFLPDAAARPSLWFTWGHAFLAATPMLAILFARRFGGEEASKAVTAAWAVAALAAAAELAFLAPTLDAGQFPTTRFVVAFVACGMVSGYAAAATFDILRGGGAWWRAPLYAAMTGYIGGALVYFTAAYWGARAPWVHWTVASTGVYFLFAVAFLPVYGILRRPLRPLGGLGGY